MGESTKICPSCLQPRQLSGYYRSKSRPDGLDLVCKQCIAERRRKYTKASVQRIAELRARYAGVVGTPRHRSNVVSVPRALGWALVDIFKQIDAFKEKS